MFQRAAVRMCLFLQGTVEHSAAALTLTISASRLGTGVSKGARYDISFLHKK